MKIFGISSINTELLTKEEKIEKIRNQKQIIVEKEMERKLVFFKLQHLVLKCKIFIFKKNFEKKINEKTWKNFKFGLIHFFFMIIYFMIVSYNWSNTEKVSNSLLLYNLIKILDIRAHL